MESVRSFLMDINPDIEYNIIPLRDYYGPTKDDPKIQVNQMKYKKLDLNIYNYITNNFPYLNLT